MEHIDNNEYSLFLSLGSNLGNKENNIEIAYKLIEKQIGRIISKSAFFYSLPVGFESDNNFVNSVCEVVLNINVYDAFAITQDIEYVMGRIDKSSGGVYGDRVIDIDLILFGDRIILNDNLIIPHPRFHEREFVLTPLSEIAPNRIHPIYNKTILEIKKDLDKKLRNDT